MVFPRIKEMRMEHHMTQKEVAAYLCVYRNVYSRYEKGITTFPASAVAMLADLYQCSMDYLLGLTDKKR